MLAEYDNYVLADGVLSSSGIDSGVVCGRSGAPADAPTGYLYGAWQDAQDDAYTLTVLSDAPGQPPPPPPPAYMHNDGVVVEAWGLEPWQQHGPAHAGNPFDDDAVTCSDGGSGSSGASPDRRCVRSLLHVALQRGGSFAQQFASCGVSPLLLQQQQQQQPSQAPPSYPAAIKQEPLPLASPLPSPSVFVSSTSSPRPATPADPLRSCCSPSSPYPHLLAPMCMPCDDALVSTTTTSYPGVDAPAPAPAFSPLPPPSYSAFRTPYPTPSPDPCFPPLLPLPVHLLSGPAVARAPTTPQRTPTSRTTKRRRSRKAAADAQGSTAAPRKRERSERQLHPCTLCDKRFKDNYSVNVHMRTHTGEKPFPCIVCGKMFRQKAHLAKHRSTHQPAEWAAAAAAHMPVNLDAEPVGLVGGFVGGLGGAAVDGNSNSLPLWVESKCKAANVWTPSVMSPPLSSQ